MLHPLRPLPIGGSFAHVPSGALGAIGSTPRTIGIILSAMRDSRWLGTPDDGTMMWSGARAGQACVVKGRRYDEAAD